MSRSNFLKSGIITTLVGALLLFASEFLIKQYDRLFSNNDSFIGYYHIQNSFNYLWVFFFITAAIGWSIGSKIRFLQNIGLAATSLFVTWGLLELLFYLVFKFGLLESGKPLHRTLRFYESSGSLVSGDFDQHFGLWGSPNESFSRLRPKGDTIWLHYNAFGARDKQRNIKNLSKKKRVVVLGDSFVEGYMLNEADRFTNLLEKKTNIEHLNLGINGTGLVDYFLKYKFLAKKFEHDVLLVGILPANDFDVYDEKQKLLLFDYPIYRPYWHPKTTAGYELRYSLADISQSCASTKTLKEPRNVSRTVDSLYRTLKWYEKPLVELNQNSYLYRGVLKYSAKIKSAPASKSMLKFFPRNHFELLSYFLEQLHSESQGKKVIILVFPIEADLNNYSQKQDIFTPKLAQLCKKNGFSCIDLLPYFNAYKGSKADLYTKGDGHWNEKGDSLVASILFNHPVYRAALGIHADTNKR